MTGTQRRAVGAALVVVIVSLLGAACVVWRNLRGEDPIVPTPVTVDADTLRRGAYLARAGNCAACHTARGGARYAGGRGIETPFGTVYASNLTPDPETGLGRWNAAEFWRAMHNGRSRDGRLLYPAFPYPEFTRVTRQDADAIFAFLRSLPPVKQANLPHQLRFPYNLQAALAIWRALYFSPAVFEPGPTRSAQWNRGRYLVRGLGHCTACHASRNVLGATTGNALGGGLIPMQNWYAPSLAAPREAGVAEWTEEEIVALLRDGISAKASVMGPMAEVVFRSTQHLTPEDLRAMAVFLKSLPPAIAAPAEARNAPANVLRLGRTLYADRCAGCHGRSGEGIAGAYPALAGNRAVILDQPNNVIQAVLHGGFPPSTAGNPMPYGMPPFAQTLSDEDVAAVASFIRQAWGNRAPAVLERDVRRLR